MLVIDTRILPFNFKVCILIFLSESHTIRDSDSSRLPTQLVGRCGQRNLNSVR